MSKHAPEPRTPRPAPSREPEVYSFPAADGTMALWHNRASAFEYLGVSVGKLTALKLPRDRYGRQLVWRQEVLDEHLRQQQEGEPLRSRGGVPPVTGRSHAEVARENFSIYLRHEDENGISQPFSKHPNYEITRSTRREYPAEAFCDEWQEHYDFAIGVAAVIGTKPGKHYRLEVIEPGQQFAPDTVLWWFEQWRDTVNANRALRRRDKAGDPAARLELRQRLSPPPQSVILYLRRQEASRQRGEEPCDCTRIYECDDHAAARRAGDDPEEGYPLLPEDGDV